MDKCRRLSDGVSNASLAFQIRRHVKWVLDRLNSSSMQYLFTPAPLPRRRCD